MKGKQMRKLFTSFIAFIMVFSLLFPAMASATNEEAKPLNAEARAEAILQQKAAIAEQLRTLHSGSVLHPSLKGLPENQVVDVIVHLSKKPVALEKGISEISGQTFTANEANDVKATVEAQQKQVNKEISSKRINLKKGHSFNTVLNAFSAKVKAKDLEKLLAIKGVTLIEPNAQVSALPVENSEEDSKVSEDLDTTTTFLGVEDLWAEGIEGKGVKVAVLDTGIDMDHPEFEGVFKGGKNFVDQSNPEEYTRPRDDNDPSETLPSERPENLSGSNFQTSHGTHVAGIIAAVGNNDMGVKGVAPKVDLYAYRVLGAYGKGTIASVTKGIETAVNEHMDIINLSLSAEGNSESAAMSISINNAVLAGVVAVSSAGNSGPGRGSIRNPGTSKLGIAVGNSTYTDEIHGTSSRGASKPNFDIKPDVVAPGTDILSPIPMYKTDNPEATYENAYDRKTGTSQAAPHISGIAALIKQAHPDWTPFDIKVALSNTAKILDTTEYNVLDQGAGRVQPYAAVHPSILAYSLDKADIDGKGNLVYNRKGTITFGPVSLSEDRTVTKQVLIKDMKGNGGDFNVTVDVTKAFEGAEVTVDKPFFTLNGDVLLNVTLTAYKNLNTKERDEIFGYIHIRNANSTSEKTALSVNRTNLDMQTGSQTQLVVTETSSVVEHEDIEISLPFAADFSEGKELTPIVETYELSKTDISFKEGSLNNEAVISIAFNEDAADNYIMLNGWTSTATVFDFIHYTDFRRAGSYEHTLGEKYYSYVNFDEMQLYDGVYSFDSFVDFGTDFSFDTSELLFVKSTDPEIYGSINDLDVTGQVFDQYIDFNEELLLNFEWGISFEDMTYDLNEKLHPSYVVKKAGVPSEPVPFTLNEDGTFAFALESFNPETDTLEVTVEDAAGNKGVSLLDIESNTEDPDEPEALPTSADQIMESKVTAASFVNVNAIDENDLLPGQRDVTKEAFYHVADRSIVSVTDGVVTAKKAGTTTITIIHGQNEVKVNVTVTDPVVVVVDPTPSTPVTPTEPAPADPKPADPKPTPPVFADIAKSFAAKEISILAEKGIIKGVSEHNFAPNAEITRAQFAVLIARALQLPLEDFQGSFKDVKATHSWSAKEIEAAQKAGIVEGSNGEFRPNDPITREQMVMMIIRAINYKNSDLLKDVKGQADFKDGDSISSYAKDAVAMALELKLINGTIKNGQVVFAPKDNSTRAQAAKLLYNLLDSVNEL